MKRITRGWIAVMLLVLAVAASSAESALAKLEVRPVKLSLLKNGLGFFTCEAVVPGAGEYRVTDLPVPVHGTFWVNYPADRLALESLVARMTEDATETDAASVADLVRASVGRTVTLSFGADGEKTLTGVIRSCPGTSAPGSSPMANHRPVETANLVVIEKSDGTTAVPLSSIQRIDFPAGASLPRVLRSGSKPELLLRFTGAGQGERITLSFLAKGVSWAPAYALDITQPREACIALQAVVVNDAMSLDRVGLSLVTGYPNFLFADIASPLSMQETLGQFIDSLGRGRGEASAGRRERMITQQAMLNVMRSETYGGEGVFPDYAVTALAGEESEDFYYYELSGATLDRDERLYREVFTARVPYRHIHEWTIPDFIDSYDQYRRDEEAERREIVWHAVEVENRTQMPWTTAPVEIVENGRVLGQELMGYTPAGGKSTVRITQAVAVKAEQNEYEAGRERGVSQYYGYRYDRVALKGELKVTNFKKDAIRLVIKKTVSGDLRTTSPEARVVKTAHGLRSMNARNELTWEIDVAAGKTLTLGYESVVLIRQ